MTNVYFGRVVVGMLLLVMAAMVVSGSRGLARPLSIDANCVEVSGKVTYRGRGLSGTVEFEPQIIDSQYEVTSAKVNLVDGAFVVPRAGGLEPGMFLLRIVPASGAGHGKLIMATKSDDNIVDGALHDDFLVKVTSNRKQFWKIQLN